MNFYRSILFLLLAAALNSSAQNVPFTFKIHNVGTTTWRSTDCGVPGYHLEFYDPTSIRRNDLDYGHSYSYSIEIPPGATHTYNGGELAAFDGFYSIGYFQIGTNILNSRYFKPGVNMNPWVLGFDVDGSGCTIGEMTTNVCFTVTNPYSNRSVKAFWKYNGATVHEQILAGGQSASRCFDILVNGNTVIDYGWLDSASNPDVNDPDNYWGNQQTGGNSYTNGIGSGSFGGLGGGVIASNLSNDIVWSPAGADAAKDSTLKDVGLILHGDNNKILDAMQILDTHLIDTKDGIIQAFQNLGTSNLITMLVTNTGSSDIAPYITNFLIAAANLASNQTGAIIDLGPATNILGSIDQKVGFLTNSLGQIQAYTRSNNDALLQLVGVMTNWSGTNGWTNQITLDIPTNAFAMTNYAQETTLGGLSNLLGSALTNSGLGFAGGFYSNKLNEIGAMIPMTATNAAAAESAAAAAQGDYGIDGFISQLNPSLPPDSIAEPSIFQMNFCGQNINLNPVAMFPQVANASIIGFRIVLLLAFLIEVGRMFWDLLKIRASTSTGGVPNLNVEVMAEILGCGGALGTNILGIFVALLVPLAFIALFIAAMGYLFSNLGISIAEAMNITAFSNSLGSVGYYLLSSFFPVSLCFSLVCTRITLQFTLGRIVDLATAGARFLWGK